MTTYENEQQKTTNYIDQLVRMSGAKEEASALDIELEKIEKDLATARADLEALKGLMSPERYYDASNAIVNNAIETNLVRRNQALNLEITNHRAKIAQLKADLDKVTTSISENAANIARSTKCIETLSARIDDNKELDEETAKHYDTLIEKSQKSLNTFTSEKTTLEDKAKQLREEIAAVEKLIAECEANINNNKNYLEANRKSAAAENQDNALKTRDEKETSILEARITELENKRRDILDNPILIGAQAKKALLEDNDITLALTKIRKLVDIVSAQEFMDIPYSESFEDEMNELLKSAETERNEFSKSLQGKDYRSSTTELDEARKSYLEKRMEFYRKSIATIRDMVASLDSQNGLDSTVNIDHIEEIVNSMKSAIESYSTTTDVKLSESEIKAATTKKENQITDAEELLASYQLDAINDASLASSLERQAISLFDLAAANAQAELNSIESRLKIAGVAQEDFVAKAIDDAKLKKLAGRVIAIKNRMKYQENPTQLLDKIERELGTNLEPVEPEQKVPSIVDLSKGAETTLVGDGLKIDHIIDLAKEETPEPITTPVEEVKSPVIAESEEPKLVVDTMPVFEPITPIDLATWEPTPTNPVEEPKAKRGNKVIDMTAITLADPEKEVEKTPTPAPEIVDNPFQSNNNNMFDFDGGLLNEQEEADENIDFFQAADNIGFGLGKAA